MPSTDGTGPMGEGPLTGRGMGRCGTGRGFARRGVGGGGGFGRGYGRGFQNRGFGGAFRGVYNNTPRTFSVAEEREILQQDAKDMELELADVKKRLQELEKGGNK